jgi:hypothetical protein
MGLFTERDEETTNEIIIGKLNRIEAKLDAVIKAMHDYDGNNEYGESSFEAFMDSKNDILNWNVDGAERIPPCVGHDAASWDDEEAANKRMDIIGQNGNEGSHYVTNEEADEDANERVPLEILQAEQLRQWEEERGKEDYHNDIQPKQKQYYKNKRSKRSENKK